MPTNPEPHTYEIAIPSYYRAKTLKTHTLHLLNTRKIDPQRITIFAANPQQADQYTKTLTPGTYKHIIIAEPGIKNVRNYITNHYPPGTNLVSADDDLQDILKKRNPEDTTLHPVTNLHRLFTENFTHLHHEKLTLWGVDATANHFFMKPGYTTTLKFCVGALYGVINQHQPHCYVTINEKEDYERTIRHHEHAGGTLRRNDITIKTRYYTQPGGMQQTRTIQHSADAAAALMARWPHLVRINHNRTGPRTEILLTPKKHTTTTS